MHPIVAELAGVWLAVLLGVALAVVIARKDGLDRILALDVVAALLVALLAVRSAVQDEPYSLDASIALALLSFVQTVAASRYQSERRLFR